MRRFAEWIVERPVTVSIVVLLAVALAAIQITNLEIDSSAEGLMVEDDPERGYYEKVKEWFGSDVLTVVGVRAEDVFTTQVLTTIQRLTDALREVEGVTRVSSLSTVNRIQGQGGVVDTSELMPEVPTDREGLEQLRLDALSNDIFVGNLVSRDCTYAAVNVHCEPPKGDKGYNKRFADAVERIIKELRGDLNVYQIGVPLTKITFCQFIERDQRTLVPWSVAVIVFVFMLSFRSWLGIAVPLVTAFFSIFFTFAFMSLIGYPVNMATVLVPTLLIAVGSTEDAHMLSEYAEGIAAGKGKKEALRLMAGRCGLPTFLTALTTFFGFLTISVNKVTILRQFGVVASFGMVVNYLVTVAIVPTFLHFAPVPKRFRGSAHGASDAHGGRLDSFVSWLGGFEMRHKWGIGIAAFTVMVAALAGVMRLRVNTDFISYFKEDCVIRQRCRDLHEGLSGMLNFYVVIETGEAGRVKDPFVLQHIARLQKHIDGLGKFDKTISLADYVAVMNREMNDGDKQFQCVPDSRDLIAQYLMLMDPDDIERYVDYDFARACIAVRHNVTSSWELARLLEQIDKFCEEHMPHGLSVKYSGEGILINRAADALVVGQACSFVLALGCIFVIMTILFVSLKAGLISLLPNALPVAMNFGLMAWSGIPLNTGTCMVAAIALGIAVDDTIHLMVRYRLWLGELKDEERAMRETIANEARPVLATSMALAAGFAVVMFSQFNPTVHFGYLASIVMITAMLTDLLITPVLCVSTQLITVWDLVLLKLEKDITKESPILKGLRHSQAKKVVLLGALRSATAGAYIVRQGERGEEMYVIVSGKARITVERDGRTRDLAVLHAGDILGEMAMLGEGVRTANAVAVEDTELLEIDYGSLERVRRRFPWTASRLFLNLAAILSQRLRHQRLP